MSNLLNTWKDRLIDISGRNSLLYFKVMTYEGKPKTNFVELLNFAESDFEKILAGKSINLDEKIRTHLDVAVKPEKVTESDPERGQFLETGEQLPPEPQAIDHWQNHIQKILSHTGEWNLAQRSRVLYNLRNRDRSAEEEMGLNVLYLTKGLLKWRAKATDEWNLSPLFLLPMDLDRQGAVQPKYSLMLDEDEVIVFNPTLRLFLQQQFGISLNTIPERYEEETPNLESFAQAFLDIQQAIAEQAGWEVLSQRHILSVFHFANLILYREMEAWGTEMAAHPLISKFMSHAPLEQAEFKSARDIDKLPPEQSFQVIDADSSQQEAIQAAKDGISFVLDGPPGTGKSQTIVNIIAELVAQGKKVLFVSQKKAALDVVRYRLYLQGLDQLCLDLHDHTQSNKAFIEALSQAQTRLEQPLPKAPELGLFARLAQYRAQLNQYAQELHSQPGKMSCRFQELYAGLGQESAAPDLNFKFANVLEHSDQDLQECESVIQRLQAHAKVYQHAKTHPWQALKRHQPFSLQQREGFEDIWQQLKQVLEKLDSMTTEWHQLTELNRAQSQTEFNQQKKLFQQLAAIPALPKNWLERDAQSAQQSLSDNQKRHQQVQTQWHEVLGFTQDGLKQRDLEILSEGANKWSKTGFFKILMPAFYAWKKQITQSFYLPGKMPSDLARIHKDLQDYQAAQKQVQDLINEQHEYEHYYQGLETNWEQLQQHLSWLQTLQELTPISAALKQIILHADRAQTLQALQNQLLQQQEQFQQLLKNLDEHLSHHTLANPQSTWAELIQQVDKQIQALDQLDEWIAFAQVKYDCVQLGMAEFLEQAQSQQIPLEQLESTFRKRFYRLYLDAAEDQFPDLRKFNSQEQAQRIQTFADLDRQQLPLNRERVLYALQASYHQSIPKIPSEQLSTLRKLAAQKRPRKKIRWMVKHLRDLILQVYPCWMMSPLSVAQFIELEKGQETMLFDTVIFDEASQIYPQDGLCSIFRGKQLIVAGDPLQMPPTSVGRSMLDADEAEDEDDLGADYESVLDLASTILRRRRLMWHYRSRFEELINPSNYHIYDGDLITFPRAELPENRPVRFHYVEQGIFEKRKNRLEAEALVKRLIELYRTHQGEDSLSVGIIAMGIGQQECIREVIQEMQAQEPSLESLLDEDRGGEDPLFIKNLENVQGDERDIILISVGYGKSKEGKFLQRFGPINQMVGHRRLNVAFTRARKQVEIFCSFHAHEIKVRSNSSLGVRFLRDYLRFAETGHLDMSEVKQESTHQNSQIEDALLKALQEKGYQVHSRLGSSRYRLDLAVLDPAQPLQYLMGIETDGAMYQDAQTARERDRLRQEILQSGGWALSRIWSRDWWLQPQAQIDHLLAELKTIANEREQERLARKEEEEAYKELLQHILADTLVLVPHGGRYAVHKAGEQIHPPFIDRFDQEFFGDGILRVWSCNQVGLLNADGQIVMEASMDWISHEPLENGYYLIERNGCLGLMNERGYILLQPEFDSFEDDFCEEFALVQKAGFYGFVSRESGRVVVPAEYEWVGEWQNNKVEIGKEEQIFTLNAQGQVAELKNASALSP